MPNVKEFLLGIDGKAAVEYDNGSTKIVDLAEVGGPSVTINNTLTSTSTTEALSAAMGKALKDGLDAVGTGAEAYPPVTLTATEPTTFVLNAADHANRLIIVNSAFACILALQTDALGGFADDDSVNAYQAGAGSVTIQSGTATLRSPSGTTAVTSGQYRFVGSTRVDANTWALTESSGASISGLEQLILNPVGLMGVSTHANTELYHVGIRGGNTANTDASTAVSSVGVDATTSALTNFKHIIYRSATSAANRAAGVANNGVFMNAIEEGIFNGRYPCTIAGAITDANPTLGCAAIGLIGSPPANTAEPSASFRMIAIACDSTDANWQLMYCGNTGTLTKIDLGASFARAQNRFLSLHIEKGSGRQFVCTIRDIFSEAVAVHAFTLTTLTGQMGPFWHRSSLASTFQCEIGFGGFACGRVLQ